METMKNVFATLLVFSLVAITGVFVNMYSDKWLFAVTSIRDDKSNISHLLMPVPKAPPRDTKLEEHETASKVNSTSSVTQLPFSDIPFQRRNETTIDEFMREQARRLDRIQSVCSRLNRSMTYTPDRNMTQRLLVDDKARLMFGFIPKVSCKMWKGVFRNIRFAHGGNVDNAKKLPHYDAEGREKRLRSYTKVLFVREPITRLLSAYLSKFCNLGRLQRQWERMFGFEILYRYRPGSGELLKLAGSLPLKERPFLNVTLLEFISFVIDKGDQLKLTFITDHFLPQHRISHVCDLPYDLIGHYENMAIEAPIILEVFNLTSAANLPEIHPSYAESVLPREFAGIPMKVIKSLQKFYSLDYEIFGYDKTDVLNKIFKNP